MSSKIITKLLLIPMILSACGSTPVIAFNDVEPGDRHYVAITALQQEGIIDGYADNTFKSWQNINRAEALKMLTMATGIFEETPDETEEDPFTDTPSSQWYSKYLIAAKEKGIIDGYEDGSFKPEQTINLAETLKIFLECHDNIIYPNIEDYLFEDTPANDWFTSYTAYAASRGLIDIQLSNRIYPEQEMTRGYLAEIIYRMKRFSQGYKFGKATFYGSAVQGNYTASGETFDMNLFTAAHKTLDFGTIVEVTNLANGKSVQVKINDRGPYGAGRVIDLSSAAFAEIASLGTGVINVEFKIVSTP